MPRIVRSPLAKLDAVEIWEYVARDNERAADKLIDQFEARLRMLADHPNAGESVDYIRPDVCRSVVGNYVIYYVPDADGITVVRILHAARRHEDEL
jgi:toxin ParE1/3/4